jgi:hypothetical protein
MKISSKIWIIVLVLLSLLLAGCKDKPTPTALAGGGDQPSSEVSDQTKADEPASGDEGRMTLNYGYGNRSLPEWDVSTQVLIKPTIKRDNGTYEVNGSERTTHYMKMKGAGGPTGQCDIHCDYPMTYTVKGQMKTVYDQGKVKCQFSLKFDQKNEDPKIYGTCPSSMMTNGTCAGYLMILDTQIGQTLNFDENNRLYYKEVAKDQAYLRVEVKEVKFPEDVNCTW